MINYVDTHTHLFVNEFDSDRADAVHRAVAAGVTRLCLPAITSGSVASILAMCDAHPGICYPMAGLHPTEVGADYRVQLEELRNMLDNENRFIAIGEVGLDFYWDDTYRMQQMESFETQIAWAHEKNLPLVIHSRSAFDELYSTMAKYRTTASTGVFHCFSGTADEARKLLAFEGFMLGIGGVLTYKKTTLPQILKDIVPLERVVLETDSPYLSPVPYRGKRNESAYILEVAKRLAEIYECSEEYIAAVTTANAEKIFPKIKKNTL